MSAETKPQYQPITAELRISKGALPFVGKLSPTQRLQAAYATAEAAAVVLAQDSDITAGHRVAVYAHMNAVADRHGVEAALDFVDRMAADLIARAAGRREWRPGMYTAGMIDTTDWSDVKVRE